MMNRLKDWLYAAQYFRQLILLKTAGTALTGAIDASGTVLTGTGTLFTQELQPNDWLLFSTLPDQLFRVRSIDSDVIAHVAIPLTITGDAAERKRRDVHVNAWPQEEGEGVLITTENLKASEFPEDRKAFVQIMIKAADNFRLHEMLAELSDALREHTELIIKAFEADREDLLINSIRQDSGIMPLGEKSDMFYQSVNFLMEG